jgi:saccharopine dehydrogenase-like NADP-dependent oxidoreductase
MKKHAVVLGCGMVGATMVRDLASDPSISVTACDFSEANLARLPQDAAIARRRVDLRDQAALREAIAQADVVLGALPSVMGLAALRTVIEAGKPYSDISFMPEDAGQLDELAKARRVTAVVDCGVAPGLSNLLAGHIHAQVDELESLRMYVGGLPFVRRWPYEYKAPFAPSDVVEEYTRPARFIEGGRLVTRPALTDIELLDFPEVGTLEAFNTDGLRSLLHTIPARNMIEKTLRYPGHARLMAALRETGFFGREPVEVKGTAIRPIDVTEALLFRLWKPGEGEREFTVLRVEAEGLKAGRAVQFRYDLYDETDTQRGMSSMARTTAFPCAIVARMLLRGEFAEPGVYPPELLGRRPGMLDRMTTELAVRGVKLISRP